MPKETAPQPKPQDPNQAPEHAGLGESLAAAISHKDGMAGAAQSIENIAAVTKGGLETAKQPGALNTLRGVSRIVVGAGNEVKKFGSKEAWEDVKTNVEEIGETVRGRFFEVCESLAEQKEDPSIIDRAGQRAGESLLKLKDKKVLPHFMGGWAVAKTGAKIVDFHAQATKKNSPDKPAQDKANHEFKLAA